MCKSSWKLPYIQRNLLWNAFSKVHGSNSKNKLPLLKCQRHSIIPENLLGLKVKVYNGKRFSSLFIRNKMIGHKFGEFSITKVMGSRIAARKRAKQKKLLKKSAKK